MSVRDCRGGCCLAILVSCLLDNSGIRAEESEAAFLVFGDSGYHHGFANPNDYYWAARTRQDHQAAHMERWLRGGKPLSEFRFPEAVYVPEVGRFIDASGLYPVAAAMSALCESEQCDFAVMLGDNIYESGVTLGADGRDDDKRLHEMFTRPFSALGRGEESFRIYTALGNHDWGTSRAGAERQLRFHEDDSKFYMDGFFYSVAPESIGGDVELFVLDTTILLNSVDTYQVDLDDLAHETKSDRVREARAERGPANEPERRMLTWLEDSLKNSQASWKFIVAHHPFWSSSGEKLRENLALRELVRETACRYADGYFAGHDHTLEIIVDTCTDVAGIPTEMPPLLHLVSGAAAKARGIDRRYANAQEEQYPPRRNIHLVGQVFGFMHMAISGDVATVRTITVPTAGPADAEDAFSYQFERRSGSAK